MGVLSHEGVTLLERIRRIRRCGYVGKIVLLGMGFKVSKAHITQSVCLSTPFPPPFLSC